MAMNGESGGAASGEARRVESWAAAPRLSLVDLLAILWRERVLALAVAAIIAAIGLGLALMQRETYTASSRVLVRLGQEYVFQPKVGGAGAGATPMLTEILNSELKLMLSPDVRKRTIEQIGLAKLYPDIAANAASKEAALDAADRAFAQDLVAVTSPQTPIITATFTHPDRKIAAEALNAYVDTYLGFRREVLVDPAARVFAGQGAEFTERLNAANNALTEFFRVNDIGDFDAEQKAQTDLLTKTEADLGAARAERRSLDGQVSVLRARAEGQPAEIELYAESEAGRQLVSLQGQRAELIAKFEPTAPPVVEIDRRIKEVEAFLNGGPRASVTRRGANPVRQDLERELFKFEAQARAAREREEALEAQRKGATARLQALQKIEPQYRELTRQKSILEENARAFGVRAEEARAFQEIAGLSSDNIRVMERASAPLRGESLRFPIFALAVVLGGLTGLGVALARGLMRESFPTAASAARTLNAPVLGVAPASPRRRKGRET
jgi:uncharacterized protein involved in exopolysaccharide biosynthesis